MIASYDKKQFEKALIECGVQQGDTLFCHSNIGFFGFLEEADSPDMVCKHLFEVIQQIIGIDGTLVVPSFTYSFGNDKKEKVFDIDETSAPKMGVFSEYVRSLNDSHRSFDPMFSVSAVGSKAEELVNNISDECFGKDSFWGRFQRINGRVCNFNFDSASTFIHYVEKKLNVSYRRDQEFSGELVVNGQKYDKSVIYFCRDINKSQYRSYFKKFDEYAKRTYSKVSNVGRGSIVTISADETEKLIQKKIENEPYFLTYQH